ncbi:MAG: glutamate-1-semialdehyde 2,1-aminomutase [Actinomycetota bacterium]|nr:glutamate-1-semialdehyde 2,1-aminomutase [Actinomycetota bacterium]
MPGGVSSPVRAFGAVGGTPVFMSSGSGSRVVDVDGREYVDLLASWGPLILGHADSEVVEAVTRAVSRGTSFGAPTPSETELAELIIRALPSVEMVRFVSSGTEATMSAIRLARAATGRAGIIKFAGCYHGHVDSLLVQAGSGAVTLTLPDSPGVTAGAAGDTTVVSYNSSDAASEAFDRLGSDVAAVIVEPIAANMGVVLPNPGFLETLRALCDAAGALLIFDEVVTGFRVAWEGAQGALNVDPDLTTLGKVIGGGLPIGAYGGRRELMEMVTPCGPVYQAGTLSGNPVSVAAGLATLKALEGRKFPSRPGDASKGAYQHLEQLGSALELGLQEAAASNRVPLRVQRHGSMLTAFFTDEPVRDLRAARTCDTSAFARFFQGMLEEGVYWPPSQFEAAFVGTAHTEDDIDKVIGAAARVLERID